MNNHHEIVIESPLTRQVRWLWITAGISGVAGLICALVGILLDSLAIALVGLIVGITIGGILGISVLVLRPIAVRTAARIAEVRQRGFLATWTIPRDEWNEFARAQRATDRSQTNVVFVILFVLFALAGCIAAPLSGNWIWLPLGVVGGIVFLGMCLLIRAMVHAGKYRTVSEDALIAIAPELLHVAGNTLYWMRYNPKLDNVEMNDEGRMVFHYSTLNDDVHHTWNIVVPVPQDRTADAARIAAELAGQCRIQNAVS